MRKLYKGPVVAKLLRRRFAGDFYEQVAQSLDKGELLPEQFARVKALVDADIVAPDDNTQALIKFGTMVLASHYMHPEHDDPELSNQYLSQILGASRDGDFISTGFILANASSINPALLNPVMKAISNSPLQVMNDLFSYCDATARDLWISTMAKKALSVTFQYGRMVDNEDHPVIQWFDYQIAIDSEKINAPAYNIWFALKSSGPPGLSMAFKLFKKMVVSFLKNIPVTPRVVVEPVRLEAWYRKLLSIQQTYNAVEMQDFIKSVGSDELLALSEYLISKKQHDLTQCLFSFMGQYTPERYARLTTELAGLFYGYLLPENIDAELDNYTQVVKQLTDAVNSTFLHKQLLQVSRLMFLKYPFDLACVENYYHNLIKIRYSLLTQQQRNEIFGLVTYLAKEDPTEKNVLRHIEAIEGRYRLVGALDEAMRVVSRGLYSEQGSLEEKLLAYATNKARYCIESADSMFIIARMHEMVARGAASETAELFYKKAAQLGHPQALERHPEYRRTEPLPPAIDPSVFPTEFLGDLYTARREDGSHSKVLCDWVRLLLMVVGLTTTVKVDGLAVSPRGAGDSEAKRLFNLISKRAQQKVETQEVQHWIDMQDDYNWAGTYLGDHAIPGEDNSILQRLNAGRTVHLNDYWFDRRGAHVMGLTFFKSDGQYYLIRSNKGAGASDEMPGIGIYRVDNIAGIATKKDARHFLQNCKVTEFSENLDPEKHGGVANYLRLKKLAEFSKSPQKTGNCVTANLINYMLAYSMAKYTQSQFGIEHAVGAEALSVSAGAGQDPSASAATVSGAIPAGFFDHCFAMIRDTQFKPLRALVREIGIEQLVELGMVGTHPVVMDKGEHIAMMQLVLRYIDQKYSTPKADEVWSDAELRQQAANKTRWFKAVDRLATDKHKSPYASSDVATLYSLVKT
ncbi:MAG: hypothetical protein P1U63_13415 [Coxiellaceae bacterium]|nr:hypothetical protein [Coxiellaceae bacterium]